jgi:hypothetical protein
MNLLNIAVAECIYGWEYVPSPWVPGYWKDHQNEPCKVLNWLEYRNALTLVDDMRAIFGYRATIEAPMREGGGWFVRMKKLDGNPDVLWAGGKTMEEAVVRAALLCVGVHVDGD